MSLTDINMFDDDRKCAGCVPHGKQKLKTVYFHVVFLSVTVFPLNLETDVQCSQL